jgi:hypothetical protein
MAPAMRSTYAPVLPLAPAQRLRRGAGRGPAGRASAKAALGASAEAALGASAEAALGALPPPEGVGVERRLGLLRPYIIHTYMHACMHAFIHTYIHSYVRTYVHIVHASAATSASASCTRACVSGVARLCLRLAARRASAARRVADRDRGLCRRAPQACVAGGLALLLPYALQWRGLTGQAP